MRSLRKPAGVALALALTASLPACRGRGGEVRPGELRGAPVVIISIDTLRSDRLPAYGYGKVETPAIDALARDSILYEHAYSHTPLTLPSHTSLLTGLLPNQHGIRDNVGYRVYPQKVPFLPLALKAAGYKAGAAVSAYVLRSETGLGEGFDWYEAGIEVKTGESLGASQRSGRETLRLATEWMDSVAAEPFFLLLHLYEPHTPYQPEEAFAAKYSDPYDGEIATADAIVGQAVAEMKRLGIYDKAIVILLSDHGEGLGDHGEAEHGVLLYREALQVPLLVKLPDNRQGGTRVAAPAQLVDIYPTIASLVGVDPPKDGRGESLLALAAQPGAPAREIYAETYYPRLHLGWSELQSLIQDRFHYIHGPDPELYDLAADPAEKTNRLTEERRAFATLRQAVRGYDRPLQAPAEVDPEAARKLAALGYLGSSLKIDPNEALPDPKSKIHTLGQFGEAMAHIAREEHTQAVPILQSIVAENPRMVDGWENLAQSLHRLGRREEALAAYEKAMELSGGVGHVAIGAASVLLDLGRLDEAQKHAELGLETGPAAAHSLLAQIAIQRGDLGQAEKEARAALESRGSRVGPLVTLAQVLQKAERLDEALQTTDQAVAELEKMEGRRRFTGLFFVRGDLLARLGRTAEAEQAFLREIEDYPANYKAYSRLAVLYASEGRGEETVGILRRMVERESSPGAYAEAVRTLRVVGDPQGAARLLRYALSLFPQNQELRSLAG